MKVALYCRVGNDDELQVETQKNILSDFCKKNNYKVFKVYSDKGFSANDKNRPEYNFMLEDLKQKKFDMIITSKLDRIIRSISDLDEFLNLISKYNCKFMTLTEHIETKNSSEIWLKKIISIINSSIKGSGIIE